MARSQGEEAFIGEMTRKLMVGWADHLVRNPTDKIPVIGPCVYFNHAVTKGWVTKREPYRLTSKGWKAAASFLKR